MRLRPSSLWVLALALGTSVLAPCQLQAAPSAEDAKKFEAYKAKAELGDTLSQYNLGNCYATGKGVLKDQLEAYAYWTLAAASNDTKARRSLATLEADMTMSVRLLGQQRAKELQKEIEANVAANKAKVGSGGKTTDNSGKEATKKSDGMAKTPVAPEAAPEGPKRAPPIAGQSAKDTQTFESVQEGALSGSLTATYLMGMIYRNGDLGVPKDVPQSVVWYRRAAERGEPRAQYYLGRSYFEFKGNPLGVEQDATQAVYWWRKACAQGDANALMAMSNVYLVGVGGVSRNEAEGYAYLSVAARTSSVARTKLADMEPKMSSTALESGQTRAKQLAATTPLPASAATKAPLPPKLPPVDKGI